MKRIGYFEVIRHLSNADLFALSSLMEGLPVVLMEAMGMGLPVVAPRLAGIPELIDDGTHGLLFSPGKPVGFAQCCQSGIEIAHVCMSQPLADVSR